MGNNAICVYFLLNSRYSGARQDPCADHTGSARQVVHLLAFVMTRPALALVQGAERRVHLPKDSESLAGEHSRLRRRSDSACVAGNILFIGVGGTHTEARVVVYTSTLRGQQAAGLFDAV